MSASKRTGVSLIAASPAARASLPELTLEWAKEIRNRAVALANRAPTDPEPIADDLEQEGWIAFWRATQSFDPARGVPFEHYVRRILKRAMNSEFRRATSRFSSGRAAWIDDPALHHPSLRTQEDPEAEQARAETRQRVRRWVSACRPRLRDVFSLVYEQQLTQREAAPRMGVTQPRITQLHNSLLQLGRAELGSLAEDARPKVQRLGRRRYR